MQDLWSQSCGSGAVTDQLLYALIEQDLRLLERVCLLLVAPRPLAMI